MSEANAVAARKPRDQYRADRAGKQYVAMELAEYETESRPRMSHRSVLKLLNAIIAESWSEREEGGAWRGKMGL